MPGDAADEEADVVYLAGQRPPEEGAWLRVTTADARHGGATSSEMVYEMATSRPISI